MECVDWIQLLDCFSFKIWIEMAVIDCSLVKLSLLRTCQFISYCDRPIRANWNSSSSKQKSNPTNQISRSSSKGTTALHLIELNVKRFNCAVFILTEPIDDVSWRCCFTLFVVSVRFFLFLMTSVCVSRGPDSCHAIALGSKIVGLDYATPTSFE